MNPTGRGAAPAYRSEADAGTSQRVPGGAPIHRAVVEAAESHRDGSVLRLPMPAVLASGVKR